MRARDRLRPRDPKMIQQKEAIKSCYTSAEELANLKQIVGRANSLVPTPLVVLGTICSTG